MEVCDTNSYVVLRLRMGMRKGRFISLQWSFTYNFIRYTFIHAIFFVTTFKVGKYLEWVESDFEYIVTLKQFKMTQFSIFRKWRKFDLIRTVYEPE